MSARQTWVLATAVVLAALTFGASLGLRAGAEPKAEPAREAAAGTYQAVHLAGETDSVLVLDTGTGHCWSLNPRAPAGQNWTDQGSPPQPKK